MLKKLRLKFVCITMGIITVMLVAILGVVIHFTAQDLEQQSLQALMESAGGPDHKGPPGQQLQRSCFSIQEGPEGQLTVLGGESYDLSDPELLQTLWGITQSARENTGLLLEYDLRYLREGGPRGNRVLFADISSQRATLVNLVVTCCFVGLGSFLLLLCLSIFLARWAIKPVEQAWKEQRQFVSDASHELKTPLTVIMTTTELLAENPHGEQSLRLVDNIQAMTRQMRGLVESLLDLSRVDSGGARAVFQTVNWSEAVADEVLPLEALFFEAGLTLQTEIEPGLQVRGSRAHLNQVTQILLDNARKYAFAGSTVRLILAPQGSRDCLLTVENAAPHLEPQELREIFKRFYRVDRARTMNHSYGLGLPIAQGIVQDHGGRIWAQSKGNQVSFHVCLPRENGK